MGLSNLLSGGNETKSINAAKGAVKTFDELDTPDTGQMILQLQELVQQGKLSPEQAQVYLQENSQSANIETDPALQQAQMDALRSLQDVAANKGLTATDKARLGQIRSEESARARGIRDSISSDAAARGMGGAGTTLASKLIASQGRANREAQGGLDVAAAAEQRALQAMMGGGQLAGQIQSTSFNQQMDQARAQDAINNFNASTRTNVGLANTDARNAAQASNLGERQRVADTNVDIRNQEQQHNKGLGQLDFENKFKKASGKAGAQSGVSSAYGNAAANNMNLYGSAIQAGGAVGAGFAGKPPTPSDERVKEDVEDFSLDDLLEHIEPKKYKYKDSKYGKGDQVGIMAQDLEQVAPQLVDEDVEGVKRIDYSKAGGPLFANLLELAKRVQKLEGK